MYNANSIIIRQLSFIFLPILCLSTSWSSLSWSASSSDAMDKSLLSLPYIQYIATEKAPNKFGTTIYKKNKVSPGYNIYTSNNDRQDGFVNLIDLDGSLVHQWKRNQKDVPFVWKAVTPFPDGSLFLTSYRTEADWQWVDANSHSLVIYDMPGYKAHHAAYCLKEGGFISLVSKTIRIPFKDLTINIVEHSLVHLSSNGRALKTLPLNKFFSEDAGYQRNLNKAYRHLKKSMSLPSKEKTKNPVFDLLRPDNIENIEQDISGIAKKGDWLVTFENLNRICIVDPEKEKIVWQWGKNIISSANHATILEGDQLLLLDNGVRKKLSRAIVLDMRSQKIIWQYGQKPGQEFFTAVGGSVQRLPNGNTLISECAKGRVFEVTPSGEIVWEWHSGLATEEKDKRKHRKIYKMIRLPYDFFKGVTFNHGKI